MGAIAGIVAPVFALIAMGAGARYRRLLDPAGMRGLNDLTFYVLIPALLFGAVAEARSLGGLQVAALYFGCCILVFAAGLLVSRRVLGAGLAAGSVLGLNCAYGNTVMLGVPVVSAAFGAEGVAILLPIIALHSVVLLPLATVLIEADGAGAGHPAVKALRTVPALLRNPVIVAILAAMAWRVTGLSLPQPVHALLAMLGAAAPTLALFCLGASLPDFATQGSVRETGLALVLKLAVLPALVWGAVTLAGAGPLAAAVAVVTAGAPTGANAFFLARKTGTLAASSAGTVVASTLLSVLTLSAWLGMVKP